MPPFQYSTPANPYAESIGSILAHQGDAWATAAQSIGQSVSRDLQQAHDPQRQLAQQQVSDLKAMDTAFTRPGGRDQILSALPGHLRPQVASQFASADENAAKVNEANLKAESATTEYVTGLAENIKAHHYDPTAMQLAISHAKQAFSGNASLLNQVGQLEAQLHANPTPDAVQSLVDPILATQAAQEKPVILPPTPSGGAPATLVKPTSGEKVATGSPAPAKPLTEAGLAADAVNPNSPTQQQSADALQRLQAPSLSGHDETARHNAELERIAGLTAGRQDATLAETARHNRAMEAQGEAAPSLTPEAVAMTAKQFAMTGQLPPMGLGKAGAAVRTTIINKAADQYKNLDLPSQIAAFKANQASLTNLTTTQNTLAAFEATAGKNLDQFLDLAKTIPDTGVPWLNTPVRLLNDKLLGSPEMVAAKAAGDVALREIARVTNDPKLSGALTDSARHEVQGLLDSQSATLPQIVKVAKVLRADMANVHSSVNDQIRGIQQMIATPPGQGAPVIPGGSSKPSADPLGLFK